MNGAKTKHRSKTDQETEGNAPPAAPLIGLRPGVFLVLFLVVAGLTGIGVVTIGILVKGKRTKDYPSVVLLSGPYCSGVAIAPDVILTAEHCQTQMGSHIWDGEGTHIGTAAASIAACRDGLAIVRITLDTGQILLPIVPDASDLADGVATRVVGFGSWPLRTKFLAVGMAHDATCSGCANPRSWKANLSSGLACKGDSGGAGFTAVGTMEKLAGIVEGAAGSVSLGCASDVVLHRLDAAAMTWIKSSIATYSGATNTTCP